MGPLYIDSLPRIISLICVPKLACLESSEKVISEWVDYYNNRRLHEALDNITPADMYLGRKEEILTQRQITKQKTLAERKAN